MDRKLIRLALVLNLLPAASVRSVYDDIYPDTYIPETWAMESLEILVENMVISNLVRRDFENKIADYGDTVNTRKPGEFKGKRKSAADSVTIQANTATNVAVKLNQHIHTSFMIKDADASKSFKDLVPEYLYPAVVSIAREIDQIVSGQVHQFHAYGAGQLGLLTGTNSDDYLLDTREVMNTNKAHETGRNLILTTKSETALLKNAKFTDANRVGDNGTALRTASLGEKYGFNLFMAQNQPYVSVGNTKVTGAINNVAGYDIGTTSLTVDGLSAAITAGTWVTIAGDGAPYRVVSTTGGSTPTAIVIHRGLKAAVVNDAVVTLYTPAAVNNVSGYAADYDKEITIDGTTVAPRVGQAVTFGTSTTSAVYSIIDVTGLTGITLDRPLEAALSNDDAVNLGPAGAYNFAFHRDALALVCRPLGIPPAGTGARCGVMNANGLSIRVTITYNGEKQGLLVTVDCLLGVKVLEPLLGAVMYG